MTVAKHTIANTHFALRLLRKLLKTYPAVKDKEYKESFNAVTVIHTCMSKIFLRKTIKIKLKPM